MIPAAVVQRNRGKIPRITKLFFTLGKKFVKEPLTLLKFSDE